MGYFSAFMTHTAAKNATAVAIHRVFNCACGPCGLPDELGDGQEGWTAAPPIMPNNAELACSVRDIGAATAPFGRQCLCNDQIAAPSNNIVTRGYRPWYFVIEPPAHCEPPRSMMSVVAVLSKSTHCSPPLPAVGFISVPPPSVAPRPGLRHVSSPSLTTRDQRSFGAA
jgi:hypothetical protein